LSQFAAVLVIAMFLRLHCRISNCIRRHKLCLQIILISMHYWLYNCQFSRDRKKKESITVVNCSCMARFSLRHRKVINLLFFFFCIFFFLMVLWIACCQAMKQSTCMCARFANLD
jgi:hypothetical protein